ncbi:LacI family DNA-binding transcriptional regulator, partial [Escherichia coli]
MATIKDVARLAGVSVA